MHQAPLSNVSHQLFALAQYKACQQRKAVGDEFFPSNCCTLQVCIHRRIHFSFVRLRLVLGGEQSRLSQSTCCAALRPFLGTSAYTACMPRADLRISCLYSNSLQHCPNIKTVMIPCIRSVTTGSCYRKSIAELTLCFVRFISLRRF